MTAGATRSPRGPHAKSAERRTEIVNAAVRVFGSRGYHGGSLREISREMGMSLTAVTHHFPSKVALLEAVLEETDREGEVYEHEGGVVGWVLGLAERNLNRPELLRVLAIVAAEASSPEHPAHEWFLHRYDSVRGVIREKVVADQERGLISPERDPGFLADAIVAVWDGFQLQWLIDPEYDMVGRMRQSLASLVPEARLAAQDSVVSRRR